MVLTAVEEKEILLMKEELKRLSKLLELVKAGYKSENNGGI